MSIIMLTIVNNFEFFLLYMAVRYFSIKHHKSKESGAAEVEEEIVDSREPLRIIL